MRDRGFDTWNTHSLYIFFSFLRNRRKTNKTEPRYRIFFKFPRSSLTWFGVRGWVITCQHVSTHNRALVSNNGKFNATQRGNKGNRRNLSALSWSMIYILCDDQIYLL